MDNNGQLTFEDDPKSVRMNTAANHLRLGQFAQAAAVYNGIFDADPDYEGVLAGIKAAEFWKNRLERLAQLADGLERGRFLKEEWNRFEEFLGPGDAAAELPVQAVRFYIFTEAIRSFTVAYRDTVSPDVELYYDMGECYFNIRDYGKAVDTFTYAWGLRRDDARVIARLADAWHALGETSRARLLFREAFLHGPERVELARIKAPFMADLAERVRAAGFVGDEVGPWIPIHAAIGREFNVKRELEDNEVADLSEQAYRLEKDLARAGADARRLLPALLNRYLWLIDHYQVEKNDAVKVDLLKKKFREHDPDTYERIFH